ncbi:Beta2-adaptin appendage, sub-domain protein [Teladorsagia circumcincta]|uniref:Beta2-adaptin appendage, sub-domain protein n=1 Tax=Teladorsagia circumcincta TaxID=45464 RepID=A0A2G9TN57_TELCI|nr:Beta2-adaptin appendage, sub-domain protein [Teladorsagia circumcincta]
MTVKYGHRTLKLTFHDCPDVDAICAKLQQNNVMTVARRSVEGQELLYHSIKYTNNIFVLSELKIHQASTALTLSLKSRHVPAVANMNEMFQLILSN